MNYIKVNHLMTTYQTVNNTQEDTHCQNITEERNVGDLACAMNCKWENQTKKSDNLI